MADYVGKAEKEAIVAIAACAGMADHLSKCTYRNSEEAKPHLLQMFSSANEAVKAVMDGLDSDQQRGILNYANNAELKVIPKYDPRSDKQYYIVEEEVLIRFLSDAVSECEWCDKDDKQAKRCQKRKDLLSIGIAFSGKDPCPYRGG